MKRIFFVLHLFIAAAFCADQPHEIVFAGYNLENYLVMDRREPGNQPTPKPEKAIAAEIRIIREINPDILGVCEMGDPGQFDDFKKRLADSGLQFKEFEYVDGAGDPERHLALLSRFPIVKHQSVTDLTYDLNGVPTKVERGFLDVTIQVNDHYALRLVGVHLKSKRAVPEGEAVIRRNEAHLLRRHIDGILKAEPETNLLIYGDFNDTKNEPPLQEILGVRGAKGGLYDLWLRDSVGDRWTHYWKTADQYSRIDYILFNGALKPEIVFKKCSIYRSPYWNDASDHRPVIATILPAERSAR